MTRSMQRIVALTALLRKQGADDRTETLKEIVIVLADEVVHLNRELDQVRSTANRAERQSRMPVYGVRR